MKLIFLILVLFIIYPSILGLVYCPDKQSACPDGTTCCKLDDNDYGCCPIPKAVCCNDHRHCCPHDTMCDVAEGKCIQHLTGKHFPLHKKTKSIKLYIDDSDVVDDDDDNSDEDNNGFNLKIKSNHQDEDDFDMTLNYPEYSSPKKNAPFFSKRQQRNNQLKDVMCADGKSKCPTDTTCCALGAGMYGCCPIPNAVCCEDHLHCCPENSKCDVAEGRCINTLTSESTPWYKKFSSTRIIRKESIELLSSRRICSNGYCNGDETCCSSPLSYIAKCCPFNNGVCCTSGTCCPNGYKCHKRGCIEDINDGEMTITTLKSKLYEGKLFKNNEKATINCPDNSICPSSSKCCPVQNESDKIVYKCCPFKNGKCCDTTCCPRGYHCSGDDLCERSALTKQLIKDFFFDSI